MYIVLKFLTEIEYISPLTGEVISVPLKNSEGYIPVYRTQEEATKASENGKFQIMQVKLKEEQNDGSTKETS